MSNTTTTPHRKLFRVDALESFRATEAQRRQEPGYAERWKKAEDRYQRIKAAKIDNELVLDDEDEDGDSLPW